MFKDDASLAESLIMVADVELLDFEYTHSQAFQKTEWLISILGLGDWPDAPSLPPVWDCRPGTPLIIPLTGNNVL
jgi:hypothetical protein